MAEERRIPGEGKAGDLRFQWLGTAGFRIWYEDMTLLIDPYLSRHPDARPHQEMKPEDVADADYILISHGHFDHLYDVPAIMAKGESKVYCSPFAAGTLRKKGVDPSRITEIRSGDRWELGGIRVSTVATRHVRFDAWLILRTLPRILKGIRRAIRDVPGYRTGPVMLYSLDFGGLEVVHLGSMGLTAEELEGHRGDEPDILMAPMQGHTGINRKGADMVEAFHPRAVIAQHHDNFYPPISESMDLDPFVDMVKREVPDCVVYIPTINRIFTPEDIFAD